MIGQQELQDNVGFVYVGICWNYAHCSEDKPNAILRAAAIAGRRSNNTTTVFEAVYSSKYIPESVNDVLQMKQRMIAVWSGVQQAVVDEAIDEQKRSF